MNPGSPSGDPPPAVAAHATAGDASISPAVALYRVRGVALGRFALVDGRPNDTAAAAAEMVAHFQPGTVPILTRHDGEPIGVLHTLEAQGPDLHFTGEVLISEAFAAKLAQGHAVSIETARAEPDIFHPDRSYVPPGALHTSGTTWHYTGSIEWGRTLVGVALSVNPAARGSVLWIER